MVFLRVFVALVSVSTALVADEAWAARKHAAGASSIIGNTLHGFNIANGEEYWQYIRRDGTGTNLFANGDSTPFSWTANGDTFCFNYSDGTECSRFQVSGSSGVETGTSGTGVGVSGHFQISLGNAKGL